MQNSDKQIVDLYIPRKCMATNRIIPAKDHASIQINIGHLDKNGLYTGNYSTVILSGGIRKKANSDSFINKFAQEQNLINPVFNIGI